MQIAVVGTGYVGLVAAACLAENGHNVIAVDIDVDKIDQLRNSQVPFYEPGLSEMVKRNISSNRLDFTTKLGDAVRDSRVLFIAVGTPFGEDGSADISHVLKVATDVGKILGNETVVVLKSTVPVGTNRVVEKTLSENSKHLVPVVSNPEFLKEGSAVHDFLNPERVVIGADDPQVASMIAELYKPFVRTGNPILIMDPESAELSKYAANAMLATRISFINEIARLCEKVGADVHHIRQVLGTDSRIGSSFLFPGAGYGGSCFPKDVQALIRTGSDAGESLKICEATEAANSEQKLVLFKKIKKYFGDLNGLTLGVWGLAFKPRTDDMREASSIPLIHSLLESGATVKVYDPEALGEARKYLPSNSENLEYCDTANDVCVGSAALVLVTEWNEFREPDFNDIRNLLTKPVIFDGRNIYDPVRLKDMGFDYFGIGRS